MSTTKLSEIDPLTDWTKHALIDLLMFFCHDDEPGYIKLREDYDENLRGN